VDIALISPPWPLFNRPSVQLGTLKAFLKKTEPGIKVRAFHPYLDLAARIGFSDYLKISQSSWAAESVFAALLFPGSEGPERLFYKAFAKRFGRGLKAAPEFQRVISQAETTIEEYLSDENFPAPRLAGISLCLNQLCAGLYIAKKIKEKTPHASIVLGGASCSDILGKSLLDSFPFLDYTVTGEGELPLLELWHFLTGAKKDISTSAIWSKETNCAHTGKEQIAQMDSLPPPDFDDYFSELKGLGRRAAGITPLLPIEASRGCWWSKCNFCNLNLQWKGYRAKSPAKVAKEVDYLSNRYMVLDFAFMDNCLPKKQAPEMFRLLANHKRDYSFFAELRVGHTRQELAQMAEGGLKDVQVGIEALSTNLLKKIGKGTTALENLAIMRHCAECSIELQANLILHFPGSSDEDVKQTLENLDFAWPFAPLKTVSFWLGMESPVYKEPDRFGIKALRRHRFYCLLFPEHVANRLEPLILEYKGDRTRQREKWKAVEKKVRLMNEAKARIGQKEGLLRFRDGRDFLLIRQILPDGRSLRHMLKGLSRKLYLAALEPIALEELTNMANGLGLEQVSAFIDDMHRKRLMFREGDRVLSLAIKDRTPPGLKQAQ